MMSLVIHDIIRKVYDKTKLWFWKFLSSPITFIHQTYLLLYSFSFAEI